jgi:PAS domain S-box-containing protein
VSAAAGMKQQQQADRADRADQEGELFRLLVENVLDYAIFVVDPRRHILSWSKGAERLLGYSEDEIVGKQCDCFFTPEDVRDGIPQKELEQALATGRGDDDRWHVRKDGSRFWSSGVATPLKDEAGALRGFAKIMRDRTELKRAEEALERTERRRSARLAVTQILAEAASLEEAAPEILRAVCESLRWDVGVLWTVDRKANVLRCLDVVPSDPVRAAAFVTATRRTTLSSGESLPGRVWHSAGPLWVPDVLKDPHFRRAAAAAEAGLHGAFACPIRLDDELLGVIELFSREIREPDPDLLEMMTTLAGQVGQFLERRSAEEQLRRSERELAEFFENASVGLHWVGPDGTILRVNRAELDMLGYAPEEYVGHHIAEFHADPDVICDVLRRLAGGETLLNYEVRLRCKDGSIRHALISSNVLWEGGRFVHTRCFTRDITARKRAEEQARFQARLLDAVEQAAVVTDPEGRIIYWNRYAERLYGWPAAEALGRNVMDTVVAPPSAEQAAEIMARLRAGQSWAGEFLVRRRDGTTFPAFVTDTPILDGEAGVKAIIGISTDISDRKRVENALRLLADASATLAALVDYESTLQKVAGLAVPHFADWCAVDMAEPDGSPRRLAVAHADPAKVKVAHELSRRYPPDPASPHGLPKVLRTGEPDMMADIPESLLAQGARDEEHLRLLRGLGLRSYMCVPLKGRGRLLGAISFVSAESGRRYTSSDLAFAEELARRASVAIENAQLYAELREADRLRDEYLAMLAHELRNPLAPIRNALQVMKMPGASGAVVRQVQDMAERQVQHMARLLDDLLDVSRISRGKIELRSEAVDLKPLVNRTVEASRVSVAPEPLLVRGDPTRLEQVVTNLLNNACKYTDPGGHICLEAGREGSEVVVRVRDNGIGIAPDMLPKIFDLFVQAERRVDRSQGGVGIGLTLVRRLVELHGGTVEAQSEGPGRGSEFLVRLPATTDAQGGERRGASGALPEAELPRLRVLVVDDNQDAADSLALLLQLAGQEVRVAYDGQAALALAPEFRPAMAFLDIGMPGMDGYEVGRRLRQLPGMEALVLVALTGWGQEEDRRRSKEAGFDHHLVKPAEADELNRLLAGGNR